MSKDKIRFKDGHFDLDLSYITERLIAMSFPASGVESTYRNSIDEVAELLNTRHPGQFCVWNLSERTYEESKLQGPVKRMGWPDHHSPGLNLLCDIVASIDSWLEIDPNHVAVVHCMAGKGRTGTVIASYLLLKGYFDNPIDAIRYFGSQRTCTDIGVEQPSQIRYVNYFYQKQHGHPCSKITPVHLRKVVMHPVPSFSSQDGCRLLLEIFDCNSWPETLLYTTATEHRELVHYAGGSSVELRPEITVQGDFLIRAYHASTRFGYMTNNIPLFRCAFHSAFIGAELEVSKAELDVAFKERRFADTFQLRLSFSHVQSTTTGESHTSMPETGDDMSALMNEILQIAEELSDLNILPLEDTPNSS